MNAQSKPLIRRCAHCQSTVVPILCCRCMVQRYCSREHQIADSTLHQPVCDDVHQSLEQMKAECEKVPSFVITRAFGVFGNFNFLYDYMQARRTYIDRLVKINTYDSVARQLVHVVEYLYLDHTGVCGLHNIAPHLMLRLSKDQEAYDFVKWYQIKQLEGNYIYGWMGPRYLDVKNADCLEDVSDLCNKMAFLSHLVAVMLLKIRITFDLMSLQDMGDRIPQSLPSEIYNIVRDYSITTPTVRTKPQIMKSRDQTDLIDELVSQVKTLFVEIDRRNRHFWPTFIWSRRKSETSHMNHRRDSAAEMHYVVQFAYGAWLETPGAIRVVCGLMRAYRPKWQVTRSATRYQQLRI